MNQKITDLEKRLANYETPKLDFIFDPNDTTCCYQHDPIRDRWTRETFPGRLYRVRIINLSHRSIEGVRVWLEGTDPNLFTNYPIQLHRMNDGLNTHEGETPGFRLDPSPNAQYVDVLQSPLLKDGSAFGFCFAGPHNFMAPVKRYILTLSASAMNIRGPTKSFLIEPDEAGFFKFGEIEKPI